MFRFKFRAVVFSSSMLLCLWFAHGSQAFAATDATTTDQGLDQYRGSFLVEEQSGTQYYWYVDPVSGERYAFNTPTDFSRLLEHEGQRVKAKTLRALPAPDAIKRQVSYDMVQKFRGVIMLQTDADDKAWYLDPLDLKMYYLPNGKDGFALVQDLALDISPDRLAKIPLTSDFGYNETPSDSILPNATSTIDTNVYGQVFSLLQTDHLYKNTFTAQDLYYGSLKGMAQATGDPYTEFYPPDKNQQQHDYFTGDSSIEGIGAALDTLNGTVYISWLVKGAPAEAVGLKPKDQIVSINGVSAAGISVDAAVASIKGPAGTKVTLTIYRPSTGVTSDFVIERAKIVVPDVDGELLNNGTIAYFKFSLFTEELIPEFQKLVDSMITPSIQGIVIDMRDNIGGITDSASKLADYWLSDGQRIYTERRPGQEINYVASAGRDLPNVPTVVLTNGETASAAEIFTAALKYYHAATVIGTKTFGKGIGQNLYDFEDGSGLKLTTFEWLTPDGSSINKTGILPDIVVDPSDNGDPQLDRAVQFIKYGF